MAIGPLESLANGWGVNRRPGGRDGKYVLVKDPGTDEVSLSTADSDSKLKC